MQKRQMFAWLMGPILAGGVGCSAPANSEPEVDSGAAAKASVDQTTGSDDLKQRALAARDALFKQLSTRLVEAMSDGGPAKAIEVCSRAAPQLAKTVGEEHNVRIGRTSFKLRNAANQPPEWAAAAVEERTGEALFVELEEGGLGALLPIRLKPQCLTCHGAKEKITPEIQAKLDELYPKDQATGFAEGDLRGWFWVEAR